MIQVKNDLSLDEMITRLKELEKDEHRAEYELWEVRDEIEELKYAITNKIKQS